mgnify:CR=1 FL=1
MEKKRLSKCCGAEVEIAGDVTKFFLCLDCGMACDLKLIKNKVKEKRIKFNHCSQCNPLGQVDYCICPERQEDGSWKSPKPSKDKVVRHGNTTHYKSQSCYVCEGRKPKYIEQVTHKPKDKPVKVGWEESIKYILYQVIPDPQMLYWALNWIKKDTKKLLSKQGERIMNKTKYLLETFVWDMGLSISENRRRLNKFVMERETNIDKLVKSIKK